MNVTEGLLLVTCGLLLGAVAWLGVRLQQRKPSPVERTHPVALFKSDGPEESGRVEEILERMNEGVLLLNGDLAPVLANPAARSLLGLGDTSFSLRVTSDEILSVARRALEHQDEIENTVGVWWPERVHLRVRATPLAQHRGVVVVIQDITEELRTQRIRREFVAHASHELKSPVAGLQTLAEAVRQAVGDDPATAERFAERLVQEADRLGRLITDLLDLSRLEDAPSASRQRVPLSPLVLHELEATHEEAQEKSIELSTSVQPDLWVHGDPQQLSLMLRNLLDNALRYTPIGGEVTLDLRGEGADVVVRVMDTGIGIPREAQERVFERFYRVDRARSRDRGGTGLGLAIVKHAVEQHGGSIALESELERGSTFTVRLPAAGPERARMRSVAG